MDVSDDPSPSSSYRQESFLSFSSDHSLLPLPRLLRRERPSSVQTVPSTATRPRCSSVPYRPLSWVKSDHSGVSEEEEPDDHTLIEDSAWVDPALNIDWRQFHIELLREEAV